MISFPVMLPRPIHRWKSFWFGILVIVSFAWAWSQSTRWWTMLIFRDYTVAHAGSGICLADWKIGGKKPLSSDHGKISPTNETWAHPRLEAPDLFRCTGMPGEEERYFTNDPETFEPVPRSSAAQHFGSPISSRVPGTWGLYIPYWLVIGAFFVPWSGFLLWRWNRIKRRTP